MGFSDKIIKSYLDAEADVHTPFYTAGKKIKAEGLDFGDSPFEVVTGNGSQVIMHDLQNNEPA